jgi:hypothetical protein
MFSRTTLRAAVGTLATLFGYCLLHLLFIIFIEFRNMLSLSILLTGLPLTAWMSIVFNDLPPWASDEMLGTSLIALTTMIFGALLILLRKFVQRMAPKWLQRE